MEPLIFTVLSIPLIIISRKSLSDFKSHGFYRFFGWEGVLWLLVINYRYWFVNPFSAVQIVSWVLLFYALVLVIFPGEVVPSDTGDDTDDSHHNQRFDQSESFLISLVDYHICSYSVFKLPCFELTLVVAMSINSGANSF